MFRNGKGKYAWVPMIPGVFYAFVTCTFIMNQKIGFGLPWTAAYIIGAVFSAAYLVVVLVFGKKTAKQELPV